MSNSHDVEIHPSSVVEDGAQLGKGTKIGPFCHVGPNAKLGEGVQLLSHVSLQGDTTIGARTRLFPFSSVGNEPQDLKYNNEPVSLEIGEDCTIREAVTINPGTEGGGSITRIGNRCTFLASSHVAHDCIVGNNVIFSNNVMLAGHCEVGDHVILGGGAAAHQFSRIGHHAFIGGLSGTEGDVIPYGMVIGARGGLSGLNLVGMKRSGIPRESIHAVRGAYKEIFQGGEPVQDATERLLKTATDEHLIDMLDFIRKSETRLLCPPMTS